VAISDAVAEMVAALVPLAAEIDGLTVGPYNPQASPPSIEIWPDSPFQEGAGFGLTEKLLRWQIRARVSNADPYAASATLYRLLDVDDPASVEAALAAIDVVVPEDGGSVDGLTSFSDDPTGELIGARWRVAMYA